MAQLRIRVGRLMRLPHTGDSRGFSLLEIMVAICILSVGLLGLAALQIISVRGNTTGRKITTATSLAEQQIDNLHNTPYDNISAGTVTETDLGAGFNFVRKTTVVNNSPLTGMKEITVEVTWQDRREHKVTIKTILSQNG